MAKEQIAEGQRMSSIMTTADPSLLGEPESEPTFWEKLKKKFK